MYTLNINHSDYVKCSFNLNGQVKQWLNAGIIDIFYAETNDLIARYKDLEYFISRDERARSDKFYYNSDRKTYVLCHALLRLVLADCLNVDSLKIKFKSGLNNKPSLTDDPLYFNLTHTKEAFAFVVSRDSYVGIDLEYINKDVDIYSIAKSVFSKKECDYIFKKNNESKSRFFLLWTRKEALLKALGIGISDNLYQFEVSEKENFIDVKLFENLISDSISDKHFLYSGSFEDYFLSIAVPNKVGINVNRMNNESVALYLK